MKKGALYLLIVLTMLVTVISCKKKDSSLDSIKSKGVLVVATAADFPPYEFIDENREYVGIDLDLARMIGKELGVNVRIENMEFDSIIPGVISGKYDLGASGFSINEERKKNILFAEPYTLAGQAVVVKSTSPIKRVEEIADKRISVQSGTTADVDCQAKGYNVSAYPTNTEAQLALEADKVDVWVIDNAVGAKMVEKYNSSSPDKLVMLDTLLTYEEYAMITKKGNNALIDEVNKILKKFTEDGTIQRLFEKYDADYKKPNL